MDKREDRLLYLSIKDEKALSTGAKTENCA